MPTPRLSDSIRIQWQARRLAILRRLTNLSGKDFDPYPPPPKNVRLSPSHSHGIEYSEAPLALSWSRRDRSEFSKWQREARRKLVELLGLRLESAFTVTDASTERGVSSEFRSRSFYLRGSCERDIPVRLIWQSEQTNRPMPIMICLQGTNSGMHLSWGEARMPADPFKIAEGGDLALQAAGRGFLAVCVEQACFGERRERQLHRRSATPCIDTANHALLLGRCLLGERVSDVSTVVDWLSSSASPFEMDTNRIFAMGNSSGGTTALYSAAVDERIAGIIATGCIGYIRETIGIRGDNEGQNVIPGILNWFETDDILTLVAPRPLITVSGRHDGIWPFAGAQDVVATASQAYRLLGAESAICCIEGFAGHRQYPDLSWPAFEQRTRPPT